MRLIFAGTPDVAVPTLKLLSQHHEIVAVLTRAPAPRGRKRILTPSPIHRAAENLGLHVLTPRTMRDPETLAYLSSLNADAATVVAYGAIIPPNALSIPKYGWFNLHFSQLPRWRGAAPVQYAIAAGDTTIATSVFQIDHGLDTGPLLSWRTYNLPAHVTTGEELTYLSEVGAEQVHNALLSLESGTATFTEQTGTPTYAPTLTSADAEVNWRDSAINVTNMIRAYTPEPGPWTLLAGQRIKLGPVTIADEAAAAVLHSLTDTLATPLAPGEICVGKKVLVGTGTSPVILNNVIPAGKKEMTASAWARGLHGKHLAFDMVHSLQKTTHEKTWQ